MRLEPLIAKQYMVKGCEKVETKSTRHGMKKKLMKRLSVYAISGMLCFSTAPGIVQAHPGRTDSSGGHHDNKNVSGLGSYHYHCGGNPAHLHSGGVCPYISSSAVTSDTSASESSTSTSAGMLPFSFSGGLASSSSSQTTTATTSTSNAIQLNAGSSVTISKDIIKIVQDVLNQKGYNCGSVDGMAGDKTRNAIKKFLDENQSDDTDNMIISMVAEGLGIE